MKIYTKEQIDMAIKSIQEKMFYLKQGLQDNQMVCNVANTRKQVEVAEVTLDALKYFREHGLGQNVDEWV
jgi:hypothetical protein